MKNAFGKKHENLGRVLDKDWGIYQNRKHGVFTYDAETGQCGPRPEDRKQHSLLVLRFRGVFFFDSFCIPQKKMN